MGSNETFERVCDDFFVSFSRNQTRFQVLSGGALSTIRKSRALLTIRKSRTLSLMRVTATLRSEGRSKERSAVDSRWAKCVNSKAYDLRSQRVAEFKKLKFS